MRLDIISAPHLSAADAQSLDALDAAVYPGKTPAQEAADLQNWARPQWHVLIRDAEDRLVSHVGALTRLASCDGAEILIGGIGAVMTHPAQRRKGYAAAGVARASEFLQDELQIDLALLFCGPRMLRYYERFGFRNFAGDTFVLRGGKRVQIPRSEVMVKPGMKALPQCAALDLRGLPW